MASNRAGAHVVEDEETVDDQHDGTAAKKDAVRVGSTKHTDEQLHAR